MSREKKPRKQTAKPAKKTSKQALTPKQEKFVQAYIETGNASEAYRAAYNVEKMKPETVNRTAKGQLDNRKIAARIAELQAAHQKRHDVTVDRVIAEYTAIAFADAGDYFDWGPDGVTVKSKSELTAIQRSVVSEVSQTVTEKGGTIRVKLHDKLNALEKLARHLGLFKMDNEQAGQAAGEAIATATDELLSRIARLAAREAEDRGSQGNNRG